MKEFNILLTLVTIIFTVTSVISEEYQPVTYGVYIDESYSIYDLADYVNGEVATIQSVSPLPPIEVIKKYDAEAYYPSEMVGKGFPKSNSFRFRIEISDSAEAARVARKVLNAEIWRDMDGYATYEWIIRQNEVRPLREVDSIAKAVSVSLTSDYEYIASDMGAILVFGLELTKSEAAILCTTLKKKGYKAKMQLMEYYETDL